MNDVELVKRLLLNDNICEICRFKGKNSQLSCLLVLSGIISTDAGKMVENGESLCNYFERYDLDPI